MTLRQAGLQLQLVIVVVKISGFRSCLQTAAYTTRGSREAGYSFCLPICAVAISYYGEHNRGIGNTFTVIEPLVAPVDKPIRY